MVDAFQAKRWSDFRRRADYAPESVYRHRTHGWDYVPVHPFGDEPDLLARLGLRAEDCRTVGAWWGIDEDATLLETSVLSIVGGSARLFAQATSHEEQWVYLVAVFDAPLVTRVAFELAMVKFAEAGFPRAPKFQLRWGDRPVLIPD